MYTLSAIGLAQLQ